MKDNKLSVVDSSFLKYLRGICIFIIVFGHVGGFWFYRPYSEFLHVSVPIFFFLSGSVSFYSFQRSPSLYNYYLRRIINLLVPYYLLCLLSLLVCIGTFHKLPSFDFYKLMQWITIGPPNAIMPFPIGQIWFLKVLFIIIVLSPLYIFLRKQNIYLLGIIMMSLVLLSTIQLFYNIESAFALPFSNLYINFYKPLMYSSFFIFGIIFYTSSKLQEKKFFLYILSGCSLMLSIFLVWNLKLSIDFAHHNFPPDIYFILGSFFGIFTILIFRNIFTRLIHKFNFIELFLLFFHKHTFSIFLLHTFSIYLSEEFFGLVEPEKKNLNYGLIKLTAVLIITCVLSPPFTKISNNLTSFLLSHLNRFSPKKNFHPNTQKKLQH